MSTPTLTRAAELLECEAAELLCFAGPDGDWAGEPEARKAHYEMIQVAAELRAMLAAAPQHPAVHQGASPTAGMTLWQRIEHVGGRINAASYVEFGSVMAVDALISHVLRDLPTAPADESQPVMLNGLAEPETCATASVLGLSGAAQPADVAQTVAWARIHPDGSFTGDLLLDAAIEDVRKRSGAWVPLARAQAAPADVARLVEAEHPQQSAWRQGEDIPEEVLTAVAEALEDAYDCTRHWSAWSYGTMGPDDFHLVAENDDRVADIARAALAAAIAAKGGE